MAWPGSTTRVVACTLLYYMGETLEIHYRPAVGAPGVRRGAVGAFVQGELKDYFLTLPQLTLKFYVNLPSRSTFLFIGP